MARLLLSKGSRGALVRRAQTGLRGEGFDPKRLDGDYGDDTGKAVAAFRRAKGLGGAPDVDVKTWQQLTGLPVPGIRERALQVTAAFEGHGFTLVQGNYDGAGLTWGIIGFTLKAGGLSRIVLELNRTHPEVVERAFGAKRAELLAMLRAPKPRQLRWGTSISAGPKKARVIEPWRTAFHRLGESKEAQALQISLADRSYFQPARATARQLGLRTELGLALCFDIHVQNGGLSPKARAELRRDLAAHPVKNERERRVVLANAVADTAKPRWREDVRSRKLTLAVGTGRVHGRTYVLRNWGLDEIAVSLR